MMRLSLWAAGLAALALGPFTASAQVLVPGYHMEREYFHAGSPLPGASSAVQAPDQEVPSFKGETHVPSQSAQGRGSEHVQLRIIDR